VSTHSHSRTHTQILRGQRVRHGSLWARGPQRPVDTLRASLWIHVRAQICVTRQSHGSRAACVCTCTIPLPRARSSIGLCHLVYLLIHSSQSSPCKGFCPAIRPLIALGGARELWRSPPLPPDAIRAADAAGSGLGSRELERQTREVGRAHWLPQHGPGLRRPVCPPAHARHVSVRHASAERRGPAAELLHCALRPRSSAVAQAQPDRGGQGKGSSSLWHLCGQRAVRVWSRASAVGKEGGCLLHKTGQRSPVAAMGVSSDPLKQVSDPLGGNKWSQNPFTTTSVALVVIME